MQHGCNVRVYGGDWQNTDESLYALLSCGVFCFSIFSKINAFWLDNGRITQQYVICWDASLPAWIVLVYSYKYWRNSIQPRFWMNSWVEYYSKASTRKENIFIPFKTTHKLANNLFSQCFKLPSRYASQGNSLIRPFYESLTVTLSLL